MNLNLQKSVEISTETFDIGDYISQIGLDSIEAMEEIERYRRQHGTQACADQVKVCQYLLNTLLPHIPTSVIKEGSTIKTMIFEECPPNLVLDLEGGIVHDFNSDQPMNVLLIDHDIDSIDENKIITISGDKCYANSYDPFNGKESIKITTDKFKEFEEKSEGTAHYHKFK